MKDEDLEIIPEIILMMIMTYPQAILAAVDITQVDREKVEENTEEIQGTKVMITVEEMREVMTTVAEMREVLTIIEEMRERMTIVEEMREENLIEVINDVPQKKRKILKRRGNTK